MAMEGTQDDSTRAAEVLNKMGVACIITLGGDGTNRVVAKACGDTPLLPISTGTNNVFPFMVEGTLAGIAAGVIVMDICPVQRLTNRAPRLEIHCGPKLVDIALVDIAVSSSHFVGTRAIWDVSMLKAIFLARSEPVNIGFSSVGGLLFPHHSSNGKGLYIIVGTGKQRLKFPLAPGLISWLPIQSYRAFKYGEEIPLPAGKSIIALDGERELLVKSEDKFTVRLSAQGPLVADMDKVMREAAERSLFIEEQQKRR
jgi:predicted polyphosphate/ATP-dependent NAD kinase